MMGKLLENWTGEIFINKDSVQPAQIDCKRLSENTHIFLRSAQKNATQSKVIGLELKSQYRVTVKKYMTEPASPEFDFMAKWNKNVPMPMRTMVGTIEKETRGMVYMKLHGQAEPVVRCLRCGRLLTNPISQHYGIGPECMEKLGLVRIDIEDVETIKKKLVDVKWEGWVIKSAILEKELADTK